MLSREVMGVLALGILWVNTLLIAASAWKERAKLVFLRATLTGSRRARVLRGDGPSGAFAVSEVTQVGRLSAATGTIVFHDRDYGARIFGGRVRFEDGREEDVPPIELAEVWVDDETFRGAGVCPGRGAFEAAILDAKKARGFARVLGASILAGRDVSLMPSQSGARLWVSTVFPERWLGRKASSASLFIVIELLLAAGCTALALHPPAFGTVSALGAASCLAFFLLVQPAGVLLRQSLRTPNRAIRKGRWAERTLDVSMC
jgi:hypothetical protein